MNEENKGVEKPVEAAPTTEVAETKVEAKPEPKSDEVDYLAAMQMLEEDAKRIAVERDNYKKVALAVKRGEVQVDEQIEQPDIETIVERKVQEQLLNSREAEISRQREVLVKKALKENAELKAALRSKSQPANSSIGSNQETSDVIKPSPFSQAEQTLFKERGWNEKQIERYKQNKTQAQSRTIIGLTK